MGPREWALPAALAFSHCFLPPALCSDALRRPPSPTADPGTCPLAGLGPLTLRVSPARHPVVSFSFLFLLVKEASGKNSS